MVSETRGSSPSSRTASARASRAGARAAGLLARAAGLATALGLVALAAACSRVEAPATPQEVSTLSAEPGAAAGAGSGNLSQRHPPPPGEEEREAGLPPGQRAAPPGAPAVPHAPLLSDDQLRAEIARWTRTGGVAVSVNGTPVFSTHEGTFVPASILKLATAAAALHQLGPDYRFRTEIALDGERNLYVRGYGDPYLVSEAWRAIAKSLQERGVFELALKSLVLDDTAFAPNQAVDGSEHSLNPYDARLGALVTNFNSVNVQVIRRGKVVSAEPQTPLTPLAAELARTLPRGTHRINLSARPRNTLRYSGEVARAIFQEQGARFTGPVQIRATPAGLAPVLVYRSELALRDVVQAMLEFSNNFIANQVTLVMALESKGAPARLSEGVALTRRFLIEQEGLSPGSFSLVEGSGISRNNRVDLLAMLRITEAFYPWRDLLRVHDAGLARMVLAKTGTLSDVHSLAGFLPAPNGEQRAFVIMLNQKAHNREPILKLLMDRFSADLPEMAWGR